MTKIVGTYANVNEFFLIISRNKAKSNGFCPNIFLSNGFYRNMCSSRAKMHRPGIEPGPPTWQASILPLNHRCFHYVADVFQNKFITMRILHFIETWFHLGYECKTKKCMDSDYIRFRGAIVAHLTPDQEVACSIRVKITGNRYRKAKKIFYSWV